MQNLRDPGLEDMLADPLILLLMTSDHIHAGDARMLFAKVALRLGHGDDAEWAAGQSGEAGPFVVETRIDGGRAGSSVNILRRTANALPFAQ